MIRVYVVTSNFGVHGVYETHKQAMKHRNQIVKNYEFVGLDSNNVTVWLSVLQFEPLGAVQE